jgi:DNA replication protein DnaC
VKQQRETRKRAATKGRLATRDFDAAVVGGPRGFSAKEWVAQKATEAQARMDALAAAGQPFVPKYRKTHNPAEERQRALDAALPADWQRMTLETFNGYTEELRAAALQVADFIERPMGFLYLYGDVGTGKSHLAAGAAIRLIDRKYMVRAYRAADVATMIHRAVFEHNLETVMDRLKNVRVLVLDDLGAEHLSEFMANQWYDLLDYRYRTVSPTIITANLHPDRLDMPRLASRLKDGQWGSVIGIAAKDYRAYATPPKMHTAADDYAPPSEWEKTCGTCGGTGLVRRDLPTHHADFGKAFLCPECRGGGPALKNGVH